VRDPQASLDHRFHAFKYCVEYECPLGFEATFAYLEHQTGVGREDPAFLDRGLELIESQRRSRQEVERVYAIARRADKRAGLRSPARDAATPWDPPRWYGDEQTGAQFALTAWLRRRASADFESHDQSSRVLAAARLAVDPRQRGEVDLDTLQRSLDWARREGRLGRTPDRPGYDLAWATVRVLGQIHLLVKDPPTVGEVWDFVASQRPHPRGHSLPRTRLAMEVGLWRTSGPSGTPGLIEAATDLLVLGYDSSGLRELAAMSPQDSVYEIEPVLQRTLGEHDLDDLLDADPGRAGLTARLSLLLDGALTLRELSSWAHRTIGHDGDGGLQPFVLLDDIYDDWESSGQDLVYLDRVARMAAHDFLADRPVTRLDRLEPQASTDAVAAPRSQPSWLDRVRGRR
jgi:hypothetical protein